VIRAASDHDEAPMRHAILAAVLGAALLAGCGGGDDDGAAATSSSATIKIVDFVYDPDPATVRAGQAISIPNADAAPHTITDAESGKAFDSGTIKGRATGSLTIDEPGSYRYICEFHPFMKGQITVTQ
jgi:plastocyanin